MRGGRVGGVGVTGTGRDRLEGSLEFVHPAYMCFVIGAPGVSYGGAPRQLL